MLQRCRWQYGSIFIRLAVVASQICEIARNSPKIRTYSSSRSSKVIDLGANWKRKCDFLLVISSNFGRISYRFRDIDAFCILLVFPPFFDAPGGETPWYFNVIYKRLESTFNGHSVADNTGLSSFVQLLLSPKSLKSCEILREFELLQFKVIQGHRSWCQSKAHIGLPISD